MFVSSKSTIVPCVTFSKNGEISFHAFSITDDKFVEFKGDKYYKKGEVQSDTDASVNVPLLLTDDEAVRQAAKELLKSRPEPFGHEVAAVMLRDNDSTGIHWYSVTNKGTLKLFGNSDPIDITDKEDGDNYNGTKTQIFFSPISAITAVKNYIKNICQGIIAEAAEREAKEASDILKAQSFIEKIHKAQEI